VGPEGTPGKDGQDGQGINNWPDQKQFCIHFYVSFRI
jgi:hypothetical protein